MRSSISIIDPKGSDGSGWYATIVERVNSHHTITLGNVEVWYGPLAGTVVVRIPMRNASFRKVVDPMTAKTVLCFIEDCTGHKCDIDGIKQVMDIYRQI